MLKPYFFPIEMAAVTFPLIALAATLPYAVYNYRKYGSVSIWRTIVLFSFAFYLMCAYYLVVLPLPDPSAVALYTTAQFDWIPFHFVSNIASSPLNITHPSTWMPVLKSMTVLEPLFNVFLFIPFGFYLAYYFKKDWKKCLLFSFFLSFFFEMTQLSGLYGIYPRPYRLFSADDLILNSFGGMLGYFLYDKLLRFLPQKEQIDQKAIKRGETVGFARRLTAFSADAVIILVLQIALDAVLGADLSSVYAYAALVFVYCAGFAVITNGRTPGKALVRIKLAKIDTKQPFALTLITRYFLRNALFFAFSLVNMMIGKNNGFNSFWFAVFLLILAVSLIDMLYSVKKGKRLWYERLSRTQNVSTIKQKTDGKLAKTLKRIILVILAAAVIAAIALGINWGKKYYQNRYVGSEYYAVIPQGYDTTPETLYSDRGEAMGTGKTYELQAFSADGEAQNLSFIVRIDLDAAELPQPGEFLQIKASKQIVLTWSRIPKNEVPPAALEKIK